MKKSTKIILVAIATIGVIWFIRSKKKTPIIKRKNTNTSTSNSNTDSSPDSNSVGSTTNAGTTLTTTLNPITNPLFSDDSGGSGSGAVSGPNRRNPVNPCAPKEGFNVTTYNGANITNITRIKEECQRAGAQWVVTTTGECCIMRNTPITITNVAAPTISTPLSNTSYNPPTYSNSCLIADTLVSMSNGEKMNIQDIKVGMEVISWNEETKNQEYSKVKETIISSNTALVTIKTYSGIELICTKEHPFWVEDSGVGFWWIQAMLLERGDTIKLENGKLETIISVEINKVAETPVYNLHISDNHTYYANSVLVHNKDIQEDVIYTGTTAQEIVKALQNMFRDDEDVALDDSYIIN